MNRDEMIEKIMWNEGGMGMGVCTVANSFLMNSMSPESRENDWKSVVAISGPPEKYTDEELEKLVGFSERRTAHYDSMFRYRMGCNLICINKIDETRWYRKRLTWDMGPMTSSSLDDAMNVFEKLGV